MKSNKVSKTSCNTTKSTDKSDSAPKKLVRRLVQKVASVKNARVRYDVTLGKWALLDKNNQPIRHFTHGFMQEVTFSAVEVERNNYGCGGPTSTHIGIATGTLREGVYSPNINDLHNLRFGDGVFYNASGVDITKASELQLMPDRRALFLA